MAEGSSDDLTPATITCKPGDGQPDSEEVRPADPESASSRSYDGELECEEGRSATSETAPSKSCDAEPDSVELRLALLSAQQHPPATEEQRSTIRQIYTPIHGWETRVLCLSAGTGSMAVQATLYTAVITQTEGLGVPALRKQVTYEALSYCWGEPDLTHVVNVNEHPYWVTTNLYEAMVGLRQADEERFLWIDAICINQTDFDEKAAEVQKIFTIFTRAEKVLVWLGREHPTTRVFVEALHSAQKTDYRYEYDYDYRYGYGRHGDHETRSNHGLDKLMNGWDTERQSHLLDGLIDFLTRPWFKRLWVVQEISASKNALVHIGLVSFEWDLVQVTMAYAKTIFALTSDCQPGLLGLYQSASQHDFERITTPVFKLDKTLQTIKSSYSYYSHQSDREEIYNLLASSSHRSATDERDRIYALQALARWPDGSPLSYTPDYTIAAAKLYETFACDYMNRCKSLALLYPMNPAAIGLHRKLHCERSLHSDEIALALPSWCPDWRCLTDQRGYICEIPDEKQLRPRRSAYDPVDETIDWISLSHSPLRIKGARLGRIVSVAANRSSDIEADIPGIFILEYDCKTGVSFAQQMANAIDEAWNEEMGSHKWHHKNVEGFIRRILNDFLGTTMKTHAQDAHDQRPILILPTQRLTGVDSDGQSETNAASQASKRGARRGDSWYLPNGTAHGDMWISPHGADFPLVLRGHEVHDGAFELVGYSEPVFHHEIVDASSEFAEKPKYFDDRGSDEHHLHKALIGAFRRGLHSPAPRSPRRRRRSSSSDSYYGKPYYDKPSRSEDVENAPEPLPKDEVFEIY